MIFGKPAGQALFIQTQQQCIVPYHSLGIDRVRQILFPALFQAEKDTFADLGPIHDFFDGKALSDTLLPKEGSKFFQFHIRINK